MAHIEDLLGHSFKDIEAYDTDDKLIEAFKDCFDLEKKLIADGLLKGGVDVADKLSITKTPKAKKQSKLDIMMKELMEIEKVLGPNFKS